MPDVAVLGLSGIALRDFFLYYGPAMSWMSVWVIITRSIRPDSCHH
jgi:hypothetical protein